MSQCSVSFSSWKPACSRRLRHSATTAGKARSAGGRCRLRGGGAALTMVGRGAAVDEPHQLLRRRLHGLLRAHRLRAPPPGSRRKQPRSPNRRGRAAGSPIPPGAGGGARRRRTPPAPHGLPAPPLPPARYLHGRRRPSPRRAAPRRARPLLEGRTDTSARGKVAT